jgi:hypothetical protein
MFCPLEDGSHFCLSLSRDALCNDRPKLPMVAVNTRRKPERCAKSAASAQPARNDFCS